MFLRLILKRYATKKSYRVSAECAIANIMRFMEHYDNNDSVTVMIVKSVMLKMIWIVYMGRPVSFSCMSFHMHGRGMPACKEKW